MAGKKTPEKSMNIDFICELGIKDESIILPARYFERSQKEFRT